MEDCKITWYVKPEKTEEMSPAQESFGGTYNAAHNIKTTLQIWNNRYGKQDVKDLSNYRLVLSFKNLEDSSLLSYCHLKINGSEAAGKISNRQLVYSNLKTLSGKKNNGVTEDNPKNYITIDFTFGPTTNASLKESDLKDLYFDLLTD